MAYSDVMHIGIGACADPSVRDVVNPQAELVFDRSKPDGTPRKVLDVSRLRNLGWSPTYDLDAGIRSTYDWFVAEQAADGELRGMAIEPETV